MNKEPIIYIGKILFLIFSFIVFSKAIAIYEGNFYIYCFFTVISFVLLFFGFRKNAIFIDTFIGIFLWLGFWLKFSIKIGFMGGVFLQPTGSFDFSQGSFDNALLVSTVGMIGLILASIIREKFFCYPIQLKKNKNSGLDLFYLNNRKLILIFFLILILLIGISNIYYGIYQRGTISSTKLPFMFGSLYKWLLLFGLASFSAIILNIEYLKEKKISFLVATLSIFEVFISNVSLLSRGMILNFSALGYGIIICSKKIKYRLDKNFVIKTGILFLILFLISLSLVKSIRLDVTNTKPTENLYENISGDLSSNSPIIRYIFSLVTERWVGIEGVMSVTSYQNKNWDLWTSAWDEKYTELELSFYDRTFITSPYINANQAMVHYQTLPGIIAFCFYSGSYIFLFSCMFLIGIFSALIEMIVYKLGGCNLILCALISQVVAYRFAHFGFSPSQSYLIFLAIFLNILIFYLLNKILGYWYKRGSLLN